MPNLSAEEALHTLPDVIYENWKSAKNHEEFIQGALERDRARRPEDVRPGEEAPKPAAAKPTGARELTGYRSHKPRETGPVTPGARRSDIRRGGEKAEPAMLTPEEQAAAEARAAELHPTTGRTPIKTPEGLQVYREAPGKVDPEKLARDARHDARLKAERAKQAPPQTELPVSDPEMVQKGQWLVEKREAALKKLIEEAKARRKSAPAVAKPKQEALDLGKVEGRRPEETAADFSRRIQREAFQFANNANRTLGGTEGIKGALKEYLGDAENPKYGQYGARAHIENGRIVVDRPPHAPRFEPKPGEQIRPPAPGPRLEPKSMGELFERPAGEGKEPELPREQKSTQRELGEGPAAFQKLQRMKDDARDELLKTKRALAATLRRNIRTADVYSLADGAQHSADEAAHLAAESIRHESVFSTPKAMPRSARNKQARINREDALANIAARTRLRGEMAGIKPMEKEEFRKLMEEIGVMVNQSREVAGAVNDFRRENPSLEGVTGEEKILEQARKILRWSL